MSQNRRTVGRWAPLSVIRCPLPGIRSRYRFTPERSRERTTDNGERTTGLHLQLGEALFHVRAFHRDFQHRVVAIDLEADDVAGFVLPDALVEVAADTDRRVVDRDDDVPGAQPAALAGRAGEDAGDDD